MSHINIMWVRMMENKLKYVLTISIIVVTLLFSNLQAKNTEDIIINEKPSSKACTHGEMNNSHDLYSLESKDDLRFGFIFGITGGVFEHAQWFVPQTKLTFENRTITSGRIYGFYIIFFLQIGKTYTITAHKDGYLPLTQTVKLTLQKPIQLINFFMHED